MKKILMIIAIIILASIALAFLGPIILLGIGAGLAYYSYTSIKNTTSVLEILWWGIIGIIGLSMFLTSIPSLIGVAALALLYYGYKQVKKNTTPDPTATTFDYSDFTSFENDWESVMGKNK